MNEGDAADWIAQLHDGAPELEDADEFMQLLWIWFEDIADWQEDEAQIKAPKQAG